MLSDRASEVLHAWEAGLISDEQVASWAEAQLMAIADAREIPGWLLDLVQLGPDRCLEKPDFLARRPLDFRVLFALHALRVDLKNPTSVEKFARWLAAACIGADPALPEAGLGYYIEHLLLDCDAPDLAVAHIREHLPPMLEACRATAAKILDLSS